MNRLVKYQNPVSSLMKDVFSNFWDPFSLEHQGAYFQESVTRNTEGYTVQLVLPGIPREDLNVEYKDSVLYVAKKDQQLRCYRLPSEADSEKITAELSNGILSLKVPFLVSPAIKIEVKNGS